ncbi:MAG: hypothetical protein HC866_12015 [Leptolyngbyaceae cyanobacterium RU_5_1]|nr:hypothetical protein [Leptolyngbyaceae cyanobacterium RU_5_1]
MLGCLHLALIPNPSPKFGEGNRTVLLPSPKSETVLLASNDVCGRAIAGMQRSLTLRNKLGDVGIHQ